VTLELKFLRGKKDPKTCATSPLPSAGGCEWGTPIPVLVCPTRNFEFLGHQCQGTDWIGLW